PPVTARMPSVSGHAPPHTKPTGCVRWAARREPNSLRTVATTAPCGPRRQPPGLRSPPPASASIPAYVTAARAPPEADPVSPAHETAGPVPETAATPPDDHAR